MLPTALGQLSAADSAMPTGRRQLGVGTIRRQGSSQKFVLGGIKVFGVDKTVE